jgi:hypothetical protein
LDADIHRHWHVVAAQIEAGLIDESGAPLTPIDLDREIAAVKDWRARHSGYVVPRTM